MYINDLSISERLEYIEYLKTKTILRIPLFSFSVSTNETILAYENHILTIEYDNRVQTNFISMYSYYNTSRTVLRNNFKIINDRDKKINICLIE